MLAITGCPRSGTTMLCDVFNMDSRILMLNESGVFTRWNKDISVRLSEVSLLESARPQFRKNRKFLVDKNLDPDELINLSVKNKWSGKQFYSHILAETNGALVGDKMPIEYINNLDVLVERFPEMKIIVLIRDGRSVVASQLARWRDGYTKDHWAHPNVKAAEYLWLDQIINLIDRFSKVDFNRVMIVHYEHLVYNADFTLKKMSEFLGFEQPIKNNGVIKDMNVDKWLREYPDMMYRLSPKFKAYLNLMGYY